MASAKQDSTKQAFETMTLVSNEAFQEGFEKLLSALNEFSAFERDSVDALIASATATSKSLEEMNASVVAYTKKSMEDSIAVGKSMTAAKSVQELIEIQADYAKSSFDAYVTEINKHSDLVSALFKDGFKPLNDRFAAAVEAVQSQR
jgi:phasin family protein